MSASPSRLNGIVSPQPSCHSREGIQPGPRCGTRNGGMLDSLTKTEFSRSSSSRSQRSRSHHRRKKRKRDKLSHKHRARKRRRSSSRMRSEESYLKKADKFATALLKGDVAKVTKLISRHSKLKSIPVRGIPGLLPLHVSSLDNNYDIAMLLVRNGADVNAVTQDGTSDTALHICAQCGCGRIALMLLKHGANVSIKNMLQQTPWDVGLEKVIDEIRRQQVAQRKAIENQLRLVREKKWEDKLAFEAMEEGLMGDNLESLRSWETMNHKHHWTEDVNNELARRQRLSQSHILEMRKQGSCQNHTNPPQHSSNNNKCSFISVGETRTEQIGTPLDRFVAMRQKLRLSDEERWLTFVKKIQSNAGVETKMRLQQIPFPDFVSFKPHGAMHTIDIEKLTLSQVLGMKTGSEQQARVALRMLRLRWHPDKFHTLLATCKVKVDDVESLELKVNETIQLINELR